MLSVAGDGTSIPWGLLVDTCTNGATTCECLTSSCPSERVALDGIVVSESESDGDEAMSECFGIGGDGGSLQFRWRIRLMTCTRSFAQGARFGFAQRAV